jgi:hypothetical protein
MKQNNQGNAQMDRSPSLNSEGRTKMMKTQ